MGEDKRWQGSPRATFSQCGASNVCLWKAWIFARWQIWPAWWTGKFLGKISASPSQPSNLQLGQGASWKYSAFAGTCWRRDGEKKKAIMILQIQPLHGKGTSRRAEGGLNFVGVSVSTRYLYSVMTAKVYAGINAQRLDCLVGHMADDLTGLFHSPVEVTIRGTKKSLFFSCVGLKGDWPALVKLGKLQRHFGRTSAGTESTGICHLCRAGQGGFPYNNFDYDAMLESRRLVALPWDSPGALSTKIPQDQERLAEFFKIDVFHTFHKGIFGDLAANAIETRSPYVEEFLQAFDVSVLC